MLSSRWPRSPSHGKRSRRFCGSSRSYGRSHHQRQRETLDVMHSRATDRRSASKSPPSWMRVCVWEKMMFLLAWYTVAAAVFLSASAASAVEDATLSAVLMLPGCKAFIADDAPRDIYVLFEAGRCIGLMQGLGYASRLVGVCPPAEVTFAQKARVAVTYIEARPERMHEDFRVLAVEAMQKAWPCK